MQPSLDMFSVLSHLNKHKHSTSAKKNKNGITGTRTILVKTHMVPFVYSLVLLGLLAEGSMPYINVFLQQAKNETKKQ